MKKNHILVFCAIALFVFSLAIEVTAAPPMAGLKLWLKADDGAMKPDPNNPGSYIQASAGDTVHIWQDKSGSGHDGTRNWGAPTLVNAGTNKTVRFDGNDGFLLADAPGLFLNTVSMYVVVDMDPDVQSEVMMGVYADVSGYGVGISDPVKNKIKWYTADNWNGNSMEPATLLPSDPNRYTIINCTYDPSATAVEKVVYFDGAHVAKGSGTGLTFYSHCVATVGVLDVGRQFTRGNISEILVYDTVNPDQYYAVHDYLSEKYGIATTDDYQGDDPSLVYLRYLFMQSADSQGVPVEGQAWNTTQLYEGTYWDLAVLDDSIAHIEAITDPNLIDGHILNNITNGDIEAELRKGNSYTFAFTGNGTPAGYDLTNDFYAMSFYFDQKETPGVTVFAAQDATGPADGNPTFGYPAAGPVIWKSPAKGVQVRVTNFVIYPKAAPDVSLDIQTEPWISLWIECQPYKPDGIEDIVGEFTLTVEQGELTCADMYPYYPMDLNHDCYVDLQDLARLSQDWLKCNNPVDADCTWPIE